PEQKCRGVHPPIVALLRGKSVTHVMRSCLPRAGFGVAPKQSFETVRKSQQAHAFGEVRDRKMRSPTRGTRALPQTTRADRCAFRLRTSHARNRTWRAARA